MLNEIKGNAVKKLLPKRRTDSHKGQNGRVLIVGGSRDYYGAPVLSALGALYSGCDLVYLFVPECNFDCTRSISPDFVVRSYKGDYLNLEAAEEIVEFGKKKASSVLLGPGLTDKDSVLDAVEKIVKNLHVPTILDADAIEVLKKIDKFPLQQKIAITPHMNEFRNLVDRDVAVDENDPKSVILLRSIAMDLHVNILLKGHNDYVVSDEGHVEVNKTGNPGMTVGGSGDVLCGCLASFAAQRIDLFDAAKMTAYSVGRAGDLLFKEKGYGFLASEIAMKIPYAI